MDFLVDKLRFLGLNEREVKVFTTLSAFGRMKMTKIAARSGLPRTTVDAIIRRLQGQGLVVQEVVGNHFEYSVRLDHVADTLNWIEKRLRPRLTGEFEEKHDEKIVNSLDSESKSLIDHAFHERRGDRTRVLLARTPQGLNNAIARFCEYVGYAARTNTKLEILTCAQVADEIQSTGITGVSWSDPNLIRLNVVPSSYCRTDSDIVVFPDRILMRNISTDDVQSVTDEKVVETMKHLVDIACETGWSVNLSAWVARP